MTMRIMGLDYGSKTVGVAVSDPLGITAQGVETICRKDENKLRKTCARIEALIEEKIIRNGEELQIGHTKEYVKIGVKNPNNLINQLVNVEIENQLQILH